MDFYEPDAKVVCMIKNTGYNFLDKLDLNFGKGVRTQPLPSAPKGSPMNDYHRIKGGLGYVSDFFALAQSPMT